MISALWRNIAGLWDDEGGQALPVIALMLVVLVGMCGIGVDVGRAFFIHRQLQAATDAAALAGAEGLPASTATATATSYSAVSGNLNARTSLAGATMVSGYPKILCLNTLKTQGVSCSSPANGNAIVVKQQITLKLIFLPVVGLKTVNIGASATAAPGAVPLPLNIAILLDTTGSMKNTDSDSNCNDTRINCALNSVQSFLLGLNPCSPSLASCGTADSTGNYATAVDRVAIYSYPPLASSTDAAHEYDCGGKTPKGSYYTDGPAMGSNMPIYKVLDYSSDYRTSDSAKTLNTSSNLVRAVGGLSGCNGVQPGLKTSGGSGIYTFAAGAMYAAGMDLINLQTTYPNSQSVMIILTDGDMNGPASNLPNASTSSGTYPSSKNQCAQAVNLASYATQYKVTVYTVAYGASSSGCKYDSPSITPCQTVQQMASNSQNFFSDYTATGGDSACVSSAHPTSGLSAIFQQILYGLTGSRLIPDNTT